MKRWAVYYAGGSFIQHVYATGIRRAARAFMHEMKSDMQYNPMTKRMCTLRKLDNRSIYSDYVILLD